jgi:alkanesulfonate monooxygenase SsuD/methylene tetrahydromethanopterin reductase-like flavin-dependent oxidoreductase (luciferase family)
MKLGRLGVWYSADKCNATQVAELVRAVEGNGYSAYWYPESRGYESMALASHLLSKSDRLMVGSSIANIYARDRLSARQGMMFLKEF